ncbi:MAG TPA: NIPSNAP family protein, partial [Noviherbaspirillum sp.]
NNQVVHLWGYKSLADREQRRAELDADPDWIAYRAKSAAAGNVQYQENKILKSVPFSPL